MDTQQILLDTATRISADHCSKEVLDAAEQGHFPQALWDALVATGFHDLALPASELSDAEVFAVIREFGRRALPLPLAETLLGKRWLQTVGIETAADVVGIGLLSAGDLVDVPWGRHANVLIGVTEDDPNAVVVCATQDAAQEGSNIAGEPRDAFVAVATQQSLPVPNAYAQLALARTVQMAGCLDNVLELALQYVSEREQFGRALSKFQAIQHNMAILAADVAAASRASDAAVAALGTDRFLADLAAAKARVGEAAGVAAELAHQAHGAMGFTHEHQLHHFTRRLWAWRDEYGNEHHWQARLGQQLVQGGADNLWNFIATRG